MSIKAKAVNHKKLIDEATFQLACSNEFTGWMVSLMRAIQLDHEHEGGSSAKALSNLGLYLAEKHKANVESACETLDNQLLSLGGAA